MIPPSRSHEYQRAFVEECIVCPECETVQIAHVELTAMWPVYIHDCEACGYVITESEWQKAPEEEA